MNIAIEAGPPFRRCALNDCAYMHVTTGGFVLHFATFPAEHLDDRPIAGTDGSFLTHLSVNRPGLAAAIPRTEQS